MRLNRSDIEKEVNILEGPKPLRDSSPMVARIKGVQTDCRQLSHCIIGIGADELGPGQTTLDRQHGHGAVHQGEDKTYLTRIPRSLTIWLESARENPTMAPLVEV
jgi:hypothetical protein